MFFNRTNTDLRLPLISALRTAVSHIRSSFKISKSGDIYGDLDFNASKQYVRNEILRPPLLIFVFRTLQDSKNYYRDGNWVFHYLSISASSTFEFLQRNDANGTVQSYHHQRTGTFNAVGADARLSLGMQYGGTGNLPCHCSLYGFSLMSEYYNEDLSIIAQLMRSNRGKLKSNF